MSNRSLLLVLASCCMLSACATIVDGTKQSIKIDSSPQGATVYTAVKDKNGNLINKAAVGVTPLSVTIPRKDGAVILEKGGYAAIEVPLNRGMNGWVWGDILLTSPLSTSIDTSTGAAKEYDPEEYLVQLQSAQ
ncbi:MAG: PEGA domain-containing protein [Pseudomonadota bacterium]